MHYSLRLTDAQHKALQEHLFPGDGKEAVALVLCGRRNGKERHVFVAREIHPIPYAVCKVRTRDRVTWSTEILAQLLPQVDRRRHAVIKIHSHPGEYAQFSSQDDQSDAEVFPSICNWLDTDDPHASAIMLPSGEMFGRSVGADGSLAPLSQVMAVGDDLRIWYRSGEPGNIAAFSQRDAQAFGKGTISLLQHLSIGIVGCSGTGSVVVEQLARLGVGRLVLVDPDRVEEKNLSRILNTAKEDAYLGRPKVFALASAIARMGFGQEVLPLPINLVTPEAVRALAECDVVFGCMDTAEGRHVLNRLATFYSLPYFDVGVRLDADENGGISQIAGAVHYLTPGGASLLDRHVYDMDQVKAEGLRRIDPEMYAEQRRAGYLRGVDEDRPAVISVNMLYAALTVNEFLARLHPYRNNVNGEYNYLGVNLSEPLFMTENPAPGPDGQVLARNIGRGDVNPLLDYPHLS